jgi:hypothetical protein
MASTGQVIKDFSLSAYAIGSKFSNDGQYMREINLLTLETLRSQNLSFSGPVVTLDFLLQWLQRKVILQRNTNLITCKDDIIITSFLKQSEGIFWLATM